MEEIKDLKQASQRVSEAIEKEENIVLFGDSDLDGVCSLIILEEAIKNKGGEIETRYFPDRGKQGYGLNPKALENLKKFTPGLLILLDCGTRGIEEIKKAKKLGFEVLVIDHHQVVKNEIPPVSVFVNTRQKEDNYPFEPFAACALAFKFAQELIQDNLSEQMEKNFLELVAIASIADKVPKKKDNKELIKEGKQHLYYSFRPGIRVFFERFSDLSLDQIIKKITQHLQITDLTEENLTESYLLFKASDIKEARGIFDSILEKSKKRKEEIKSLVYKIKQNHDPESSYLIKGGDFPSYLTGPVSSFLLPQLKKPIFIYSKAGEKIFGSVRSPKPYNGVEILEHCSEFLEKFGGHPRAAGFTIKKGKLKGFKEALKNYFKKKD